MEWHQADVAQLRLIDQLLAGHNLSPAEYDVVRRVVYATGDLEYLHLIRYSEQALQSGVAALAAHVPIVVDVTMVQVGLLPQTQDSFANPIYCGAETFTRPQQEKSRIAFGMETLARRHPTAIFVISSDYSALEPLLLLVEAQEIRPALIIDAAPNFLPPIGDRLQKSWVPHITIKGSKGGVAVATAIVNGLIQLAWTAYGEPNP
ncbi:precorrin-8X methylmutase [Parathermosynechococcus lividus]|jgi:precorrin-8X/cobalt-precorrin-8 methylmutase|uniref:Precorrin-8X methylmutase n=1 Tax=Parathermosynechococcus lividus PCC 6715 TaxID=1917166 RepID=A0A2D2Q493_PARLV|nr:precorrin-8X methylmutase [Thermostichus lividus]ATS19354.1 precorrin-8X methylmutase [Thermostichus lividus PCC 6715]MCH9056678.1 precorrin-8X methylmutase [Synechococcus sp. PCC 6716]